MTNKAAFNLEKLCNLHTKVTSIRYTHPTLSKFGGYTFQPHKNYFVPIISPAHPFYREQHDSFNIERFQYSRPPIDLGESRLDFQQVLSTPLVNVLRLPIKYPGSEFRLPKELHVLFDFIEQIAEYESGFNSRFDECFVHITVDKSKVDKGTTHRYPGFHGDGLQGAKFSQKSFTPIEHSYVSVSAPPTEFCIQPFFVSHLTDAKHNIFHEFELQARESNIFLSLPQHTYLLDPYMVHRTPVVQKSLYRIFVRITVAYSELMNPHNTENPLFDKTEVTPRHDIRSFLSTYPAEIPWEMYGLWKGPKSR